MTTKEQFPLSPKKILKKTLAKTVAWIIIFAFLFLVLLFVFGSLPEAAWSVFGLIIIVSLIFLLGIITLTYLYEQWYYNTYYYDLGPDYIVIKKGPITPREITIPYERVQDVYVDQDLFDRFFNLYDVHLSSATVSSGMEAHIDGVEKPAADGLRAQLLQTVSERISKKTSVLPSPVNK